MACKAPGPLRQAWVPAWLRTSGSCGGELLQVKLKLYKYEAFGAYWGATRLYELLQASHTGKLLSRAFDVDKICLEPSARALGWPLDEGMVPSKRVALAKRKGISALTREDGTISTRFIFLLLASRGVWRKGPAKRAITRAMLAILLKALVGHDATAKEPSLERES